MRGTIGVRNNPICIDDVIFVILSIFGKVKELGTAHCSQVYVDVSNMRPALNPDEFKAQQRQMRITLPQAGRLGGKPSNVELKK